MQCKFRFVSLLALIVSSGCSSSYIGAPVIDVIVDGKPNTTIIKPAFATVRESFAASELQRYIEKISGASLPILPDNQAVQGNQILIGGPERNAQILIAACERKATAVRNRLSPWQHILALAPHNNRQSASNGLTPNV